MNARGILICGLCLYAAIARADTHYVAQAGQTPSGTYTNWSSAASNIQAAINVASAGTLDTVLVSNGVYTLTNQIVITNGITVQGLSGKLSTFVNGNYPTTTNRCFWISNTLAIVDGFTITNGCLNSDSWLGGGVRIVAGTVRNCSIISNTLAGNGWWNGTVGVYMDSSSCVLSNCLVAINTSVDPAQVGGVDLNGGLIDGCSIVSNYGCGAGGISMDSGTVINSTSEWNTTWWDQGGAGVSMSGGMVSNCVIRKDTNREVKMSGGTLIDSVVGPRTFSEQSGIGMSAGNVVNCLITSNGNALTVSGGTVSNCTITDNLPYRGVSVSGNGIVRNCLISGNYSIYAGSGVVIDTPDGVVENCTIVATLWGGIAVHVGASGGIIKNCIIYDNAYGNWSTADPLTASFINCCTTPTNALPGSGNITNDPAFVNYGAGNYRLSANSPCINKGLNQAWMTDAVDRDGKRRVDKFSGRVDLGCYEFMLRGTLFGFR